MNIEEYEYSPKAAQDSARRQAPAIAAQQAQEHRNRAQATKVARELSEAQQRARQPIEDAAALARSLIELGNVLGVQPKVERRRKAK